MHDRPYYMLVRGKSHQTQIKPLADAFLYTQTPTFAQKMEGFRFGRATTTKPVECSLAENHLLSMVKLTLIKMTY